MNSEVKTERLTLKPYDINDQELMIKLLTNEQIKKTFMIPDFKSHEKCVAAFNRLYELSQMDSHYERGIYLDGKMIGFLNDVEIKDGTIELGYLIDPAYHGKGYATEAFGAAIKDLFALGYKQVVAGAFEHNIASIRVMQKCGLTKIEKEEDITYHGETIHCVYYAIEK